MDKLAESLGLPVYVGVILELAAGLLLALFAAWIAVWLTRNKFRSERWWEKKAAAYERVIDAFHKAKRFDYEYLRAEELDIAFDDARKAQLNTAAAEARDEILRSADIGSFILSPKALEILSRYKDASENMPRQESWYEHLDMSWSIADDHMKEFVAEAKADLKRKAD
ncbi:hypothetical protein VA603_07385 [Stenotrophomonas sp. MH1]|uniref:Transmembrane protein n=1 Tax=Stenotrophomonas capsici TaxID=3110230 RepID=A0ABU5V2F1_9GAMM|nr:hypothetical protein [Stenotrophomonas sp. MH1]MEA5667347.1 hypothetical protein [Stenotrophomonas sp. MH1]